MRFSFKAFQKQYPDAIRVQMQLSNPHNPIPIYALTPGWGHIVHNQISRDGRKQTFIAIRGYQPIPMIVIYGKQGSGKTTMARHLVEEYQKDEVYNLNYGEIADLLKVGTLTSDFYLRPTTKVIVIEGAPQDCLYNRLRLPFYSKEGIVIPEKIIVTVQSEEQPLFISATEDDVIQFIRTPIDDDQYL